MIRLLEADDTSRSSSTFGLCGLNDWVSCKVTEVRNGEYYLEGEYPTSGRNAEQLMVDRLISAKPNRQDDRECFRIAKLDPPISGTIKVTAYHHSYDLKGIVTTSYRQQAPNYTRPSQWLMYYLSYGVPASHPTFVFQDDMDERSVTMPAVNHPMSIRQIMGGMDGSILDVWGGEYKYNDIFVKLLKSRGKDTGKKIVYGANMISMNQEISNIDAWYAAVPYFMSETNGCISGSHITPSEQVYVPPFNKTLALDLTESWKSIMGETEPSEAQLDAFAEDRLSLYLQDPTASLDVEYIELADSPEYAWINSGAVGLCDTVTVIHPASGTQLKAKIVKTEYDVLTERYNKIQIGTIKKSLVDLLRKIK